MTRQDFLESARNLGNSTYDFVESCIDDILDDCNIQEALYDWVREQEIIYYSNAMEYLMEHDASLSRSLELASDLGYSLTDLGSELLATLVYQEDLIDEVDVEGVEDLYQEYLEEQEEEDEEDEEEEEEDED